MLALHLTTPPHLDNAAILVANDVMTSLALGTTCTEAEVLLASTMWLQRRAGAASFPPEAYDLTLPWVQCLSLPLTRDSEATRWAMAEPPLYLVSGTFMEHALSSSRLLSTLATRGPEGLAARWSTYPTAGTPFRTICEAYLDLTVHKTTPDIDAATVAGLDLPEGSILAAVRDHTVGLLQNDPTTLTKALHAFIATHAWECARVVNRDLATVTADGPSWAKKVKADQRLLQSEMRSVAAAQASLTPRERQIMRLASQGLRNKQIAEDLYVSVRTVESHLYRALHKLSAVREELTDGVEASSS